MSKIFSEWNGEKGVSDITTKLTDFCPIYFPVTSIKCEIVARLMLETNNNNMRNNHMLVAMSGKKLTSVQRCKTRLHKDYHLNTQWKAISHCFWKNHNLSISNDISTPPFTIAVRDIITTRSSLSVAKILIGMWKTQAVRRKVKLLKETMLKMQWKVKNRICFMKGATNALIFYLILATWK